MKKRVLFTLACLFLWTGMAMAQEYPELLEL